MMMKLPRKFQNEFRQATIDGDVTYYVGENVRALGSRGTILKVSQNSAYIQFKGYEMEAAWSDIKKISEEERQIARQHKKIALPEQVRPSTKHPSHRKTRGDVLKRDTERAPELSEECERQIRERDAEIENLKRANEALHETTERLNRECREYNQSAMNVTPEGEIVPTRESKSKSTKSSRGKAKPSTAATEEANKRSAESLHAIRIRREGEENHQYSRREMCRIVADVLGIDAFDQHINVYLNADTDEILLVTRYESQKRRIEEQLGFSSSTIHIKAKIYEIQNETYYVFVIDQWGQDSMLRRYFDTPHLATVRHIFDNSRITITSDGVKFYPARLDEINRYLKTLSDSGVHYTYNHTKNKKAPIESYEFSLTMNEWHELRRWFDAKADNSGSWNDRYSQDLPFYIKQRMNHEPSDTENVESEHEASSKQERHEQEAPRETVVEADDRYEESSQENENLDRAETSMNAIQELLRKALKS